MVDQGPAANWFRPRHVRQTNFAVRHGPDLPETAAAFLAVRPSPQECLLGGGLGVAWGVVLTASHSPVPDVAGRFEEIPLYARRWSPTAEEPAADESGFELHDRPQDKSFVGVAQTALSAERGGRDCLLDGIVSFGESTGLPFLDHARRLAEVLRALVAAQADLDGSDGPTSRRSLASSWLSLESPTQVPRNVEIDPSDEQPHERHPSSSPAVRFVLELPDASLASRLSVVGALVKALRRGGHDEQWGLWVDDPRAGARAGNFVPVLRPGGAGRAGPGGPRPERTGGRPKESRVLPVTLVGPSRPGTTSLLLRLVLADPDAAATYCSLGRRGDLEFLSLGIPVVASEPSPVLDDRIAAVFSQALHGRQGGHVPLHAVLPTLLALAAEAGPAAGTGTAAGTDAGTGTRAATDTSSGTATGPRAGQPAVAPPDVPPVVHDFQTLAGPVVTVDLDREDPTQLAAVWLGWQARVDDVPVASVLQTLACAARRVCAEARVPSTAPTRPRGATGSGGEPAAAAMSGRDAEPSAGASGGAPGGNDEPRTTVDLRGTPETVSPRSPGEPDGPTESGRGKGPASGPRFPFPRSWPWSSSAVDTPVADEIQVMTAKDSPSALSEWQALLAELPLAVERLSALEDDGLVHGRARLSVRHEALAALPGLGDRPLRTFCSRLVRAWTAAVDEAELTDGLVELKVAEYEYLLGSSRDNHV